MKRRLHLNIIGVIIVMGILSLLTGCFGKNHNPNPGEIVSFSYHYDGTIGGDNFTISVRTEADAVTLAYETMEYPDYGEMTATLPSEVLRDLHTLYTKHSVFKWNGFHKNNRMVKDGSGFSLTIGFADGKTCEASGMNAVPDRYMEFKTEMLSLFEPYLSAMKEEKKQSIVEKGFNGALSSVFLCFKQQGASGSDDYSFHFYKDGEEVNFDVTIASESGEFFEVGAKRYCCSLPAEAIDFEAIRALTVKYNLKDWYNWNETDNDYKNCEWFQMHLTFTDGSIPSCGTAHPAHYEEFRSAFLQLMVQMIENAEQSYGLKTYS